MHKLPNPKFYITRSSLAIGKYRCINALNSGFNELLNDAIVDNIVEVVGAENVVEGVNLGAVDAQDGVAVAVLIGFTTFPQ